MVDTAMEPAQPSPVSHSAIQPWNSVVHEMAMNAIIQKHGNSVSPVVTPTSKTIKSLCIPSIGSSAGASVIQPSYITVNPSGAGTSSLPLIAHQLGDLGGASVVQLAPIGYTSTTHSNETGFLHAHT